MISSATPLRHCPFSTITTSVGYCIPAATAINSRPPTTLSTPAIPPKYFGLKKGIVRYTLVANNVPVNARNISADDHESHFVFDILYSNSTDIQSDIHSVEPPLGLVRSRLCAVLAFVRQPAGRNSPDVSADFERLLQYAERGNRTH